MLSNLMDSSYVGEQIMGMHQDRIFHLIPYYKSPGFTAHHMKVQIYRLCVLFETMVVLHVGETIEMDKQAFHQMSRM